MRWPPDMEGSCNCTEQAIMDSQQGVILQRGVYGEIPPPHSKTSILRNVLTMPWVGSSDYKFIKGGEFLASQGCFSMQLQCEYISYHFCVQTIYILPCPSSGDSKHYAFSLLWKAVVNCEGQYCTCF